MPKFRASKINLPRTSSGFLTRPRLDALWDLSRTRRLVLLTAGAGFGKTSFLVDRAHAFRRPCAWFTLNELDADPAHLADRLIESLNEDAFDMAGGSKRSSERVLATLITALREEKKGRLIVLDDVHTVATSRETLHFIERLARYLPAECTLVLSSREHLNIPIMRLQSQGEASRIETSDLAFTEEEVERLFEMRLDDVRLESEQARRIASLTEGWAAGLEIFFQFLAAQSDLLIEESLDHFQSAEVGWFPYFAEEVLNGLAPALQSFLLRSSVLPRMDAQICDELLGRKNSARILKKLVAGNLFTFACEDGSGAFRYHQLFRDALGERLTSESSPTEMRVLHQAAAAAFHKRELWVEAIRSYSEAEEFDVALRLVDRLGESLLSAGRYEDIRSVLDSIPATLLAEYSGALLALGRIHDIQGRWSLAEKRYRSALKLNPSGKRRLELMSLIAQLKIRLGQYRACLKLCDEILAGPGPLSPDIRGRVLCLRGVSSCDLGRYTEGEAFILQAEAIFRRSKDEVGEGRALYLLAANVHVYLGEFSKAKSAARRSLAIFRKLKELRRICHSLGVLGWVMLASGDLHEARKLSEATLRQAESLPYPIMIGISHYTLGRCDLVDGNLDSARRHFEISKRLGEELGEMELQCVPFLGLAETALEEGNRHAARRNGEHALEVAVRMKERQLEGHCNLVLGLCFEKTRKKRTNEYWTHSEKLFRRVGASYYVHHLQLLRVDVLTPDDNKARKILESLLVGVANMEHEQLFLLFERKRAPRVLVRALRLGVEPDYVVGLLSRLGRAALPELLKLSEDSTDALRLRAVELLSQIGGSDAQGALQRLANTSGDLSAMKAAEELDQAPRLPLRISALGPLVLTLGGREIRFGEWKSKRALRLFQLLLSKRFLWVPQDQVLEQLWPGTDPKKAKNNLRQSTFLLRKTLEPDMEEARNSHYVRHRNEASRLEPGEGYYYDVAEFEVALDTAEEHWKVGDRKKAAPLFERGLELYSGDYLVESPYEEIAVLEREHLRDRCARGIGRLLDIYKDAKQFDRVPPLCRRGLSMDPYEEEFYYHLVVAQIELGNRREALDDYHRYEEMMIRELDLLPSSRMQELAEKAALLGKV